jgi:chromosome partitioning protein
MKVIAVANPKGGSGKTTLITNLACFLACWDYSVIILDADPQASAADWASLRPSRLPRISVLPCDQDELPERLANARQTADNRTLVLLDLPAGFSAAKETHIHAYIDVLLVPTIASPFDVRAMVRHLFQLYRNDFEPAQGPATAIVVNRARKNTLLHQQEREFLTRMQFPLIGEIRETQNYPKAAHEGKGVQELPVRDSIKDLLQWRPILAWVAEQLRPGEQFDLFPAVQHADLPREREDASVHAEES